jgi:hypothetical protein
MAKIDLWCRKKMCELGISTSVRDVIGREASAAIKMKKARSR